LRGPEQNSVWTCPPKLAPEEIEPETLRVAHSKISSQLLGQLQMGLNPKFTKLKTFNPHFTL